MASVAEGWLITDLEPDRKPFYLGLIAISFAIPMMVLPPFGGVFADRLPKITGLKITQVAFLIVNSAVAVLALTGHISVPMLVIAAFLGAVVLAFDSPIRHAIVPDLVPREQLTSAISINAVAFSGAGLLGPAIGGLLIPLISPSGVFVVNAISSVSVLIALKFIRNVPNAIPSHAHRTEDPRAAIKRAYAFMRNSPLIFGLFLLASFAGLFGRSYGPLLTVLSRDVYHVGSTANGILISASGLGAMVGGLGLSAMARDIRQRGQLAVALLIANGVILLVLAVWNHYLVGIIALLTMGAFGAAGVALITSLVQEHAPPELRGRIMGFFLLTMISFPSAGAFALGLFADLTSIQFAFGATAVIMVIAMLLVAARNRTILQAT
jgi:MFS family permease